MIFVVFFPSTFPASEEEDEEDTIVKSVAMYGLISGSFIPVDTEAGRSACMIKSELNFFSRYKDRYQCSTRVDLSGSGRSRRRNSSGSNEFLDCSSIFVFEEEEEEEDEDAGFSNFNFKSGVCKVTTIRLGVS